MDYETLEREWLDLVAVEVLATRQRDAELVQSWETDFQDLQVEVAAARDDWLGGPRTLLGAMDVQNSEVRLTAAVAWLLRPDGYHGLGSAFLRRFLDRFHVEADLDEPIHIRTEETIGNTRADLVVRVAGATLLVESKVHAHEQPEQLDRLAEGWSAESPTLIFLTRTSREPLTAVESRGRWRPWLWSEVSADARTALEASGHGSGGVHDLIETLDNYHHAEGAPVSDARTDFYLRHRRQIEEWAALRGDARQVLEQALIGITDRAQEAFGPGVAVLGEQLDGGAWPHISASDPSWRTRGCLVKVSVAWNRSQLLSAAGETWPYVGVHVDTAQEHAQGLRKVIKAEGGKAAHELGWTSSGTYWPFYGYVEPRTDVVDPAELADRCWTALQAGWERLAPVLEYAVRQVTGGSHESPGAVL